MARVVIITGELPYESPGHAGGVYVQHLHRLVASRAELTVIAPSSPANREAAARPGTPDRVVLSRLARPATGPHRAAEAVAARLDSLARGMLIGLPSYAIARALLTDSPERTAVARADLVDLQWSESIRLAPLIRCANSRARIVGTFHDVQSQVVERLGSAGGMGPVLTAINRWQLRRAERAAVGRLDCVVVFSEKDAALLGGGERVMVVRPPLACDVDNARQGAENGCRDVLMVGAFSRPENAEAAEWILDRVWPDVVKATPGARLRLVGPGASDDLRRRAAASSDVAVVGFVKDLDREYARAAAVAVPIQRGAGVKFKTIEALVRGVPVVTTTVGAEGVTADDHFWTVADEPVGFARGLTRALLRPVDARAHAAAAAEWARAAYGWEGFARGIARAYGVSAWESSGSPADRGY